MRYTTSEYLRDQYPSASFVMDAWDSLHPKLKRFFNKAIDFEYEEYVFRIADNLFLGFLIVYLGFLGIFTLTKYSERANGLKISPITTNSMSPAINPGSLVISAPQKKYSKDDIINYKEVIPSTGFATGRAVTHRIIDVVTKDSKTYFIAKGDSNSEPDPILVAKSDILGKIVLIIPFLGYFDLAIKTIPGFIVFILTPTVLLITHELKFLRKESKKIVKQSAYSSQEDWGEFS